MSSSSPGRAKQGKKKKIFSSVPPPAFSLKDADNPHACHVVEEWRGRTPWAVRGSSTVAAPATSPSPVFIFAYKNRGKGRKNGEGDEKKKKENKTRENRRKRRERREKRGEAE
jgi:hypothetical protein